MDGSALDLDGCAELLGVRRRHLERARDGGQFPRPDTERDGRPAWTRPTVLRWWAAQGPQQATAVPIRWWPPADRPAQFLGATRWPVGAGPDDVVLRWSCPSGVVGMLWQDDLGDYRPGRAALADTVSVLLRVDGDLGNFGPALSVVDAATGDATDTAEWPDVAAALGCALPYWPLLLRDPDRIATWQPGAPTVEVPARTDNDLEPLLAMASLFTPGHPTYRTLTALAGENRKRALTGTLSDLATVDEHLENLQGQRAAWPGLPEQVLAVAARPLHGPDELAGLDALDPDTARAGWAELLDRSDPLSWRCVTECRAWDGGRWFPFPRRTAIDPTTPAGSAWSSRLLPVGPAGSATGSAGLPTAFVGLIEPSELAEPGKLGERTCYRDPLTGSPAITEPDGGLATLVPQHLPVEHPLAHVVLDPGYQVRIATTGGFVYPAPRSAHYGLSWGYGGTGPAILAELIERLLDDITAPAVEQPGRPAPGLAAVTELTWPAGTVLDRDLLDAARCGQPWTHPDHPEP